MLQANYKAGMAAYLDVLTADVQFHQADIAYLQAVAQRHQDTVALFVALGGGWWNAQVRNGGRQDAMKYSGILRIGFKLLVNDKAKFSALLIGITFAVFLMVQMTAMFAGILNRAYSTVTNIGATMWIMDPAVNTPTTSIPMPDYLLDAVRSMDGVSYAVPLFIGGAQLKLGDGTIQSVSVIGLDDTSLFGRPELEQGNILDIYADNSFVVVKDVEFPKLQNPKIGTTFELNDHRGIDCRYCQGQRQRLESACRPCIRRTAARTNTFRPRASPSPTCWRRRKTTQRFPASSSEVAKFGYLAMTKDEFNERIANYYTFQTGIGTNILLMTVISFIVGLSISGQTFYTFILENIDKFGALKAIGAKGSELVVHDPIHGDLYLADRLRLGHRPR